MAENSTILMTGRAEPTGNPPTGKYYQWTGTNGHLYTKSDSGDVLDHGVDSEGIPASTVDAKGDLLVGTANDALTNLSVGTTANKILTPNTGEATGLKWVDPFANKYKVTYVTTATYTIDLTTDQAIIIAYTSGSCTVTFQSSSGFPQDGYGFEYMIANYSPYEAIVNFSSSETLPNGLTELHLPNSGDVIRIGASYPTAGTGWFLLSPLRVYTQIEYSGNWASTNFSSETAVPFNTTTREENALVVEHDNTNISRLNFKIAARHALSFWLAVDSTGGSSYSVSYRIRINGTTTLQGTVGRVGNYQTEDSSICLGTIGYVSEEDDYIELLLDQNYLTGNANNIVMSCVTTV